LVYADHINTLLLWIIREYFSELRQFGAQVVVFLLPIATDSSKLRVFTTSHRHQNDVLLDGKQWQADLIAVIG
jgi:hypothetical protein